MNDDAQLMAGVLEGLGPTNRIARQLVNRLELAEDGAVEAHVILDELWDIWEAMGSLARVNRP
jgi:hypothetical protein